jgi:hypothetical protein
VDARQIHRPRRILFRVEQVLVEGPADQVQLDIGLQLLEAERKHDLLVALPVDHDSSMLEVEIA